jgi:TolA-binding protein
MSGNVDLTLIFMASQKAQTAAEAALASSQLLESEAGHRLGAIEARMGGVEGRLTTIAAGQNSHELAIMRIANTQADHTARLTRIEATLATMDGRIDDLAQSQQRIEQALAAIAARLP